MKRFIEMTINTIKQKSKDKYWLVPFCIFVLWIIDTIVSLFSTGFVKIDILFILLFLAKLGVLAYTFFIFWNLFINGKIKYYNSFKVFVGYAVVFIYVFYALPRLSWEIQKLIQPADSLRLWIFSFIASLIVFCLYWTLRFSKTQLHWGVITEKEYKELKSKKKKKKDKKKKKEEVKKTVKEHIIENVHVVIQAIITVIIIQHFTFQLYEIPTESMVPTFLEKDRVLVTKFQYGPSIPLTNWRLPSFVPLKRGDIVVYQSPDYEQNDVVKMILHEFVFYLTLSTVNIDKDEKGEVRKQLIVKRLIGIPGEKLKMIDDVVYVKRPGDKDFKVLEEVRKYAHVDLYNEPYDIQKRIKYITLSQERRELLDKWDDWKRRTNPEVLNDQLISLAAETGEKLKTIDRAEAAAYYEKIFSITQPDYKNDLVLVENFLKRSNIDTFGDIGALSAGNTNFRNDDIGKILHMRSKVVFGYDHLLFWKLLKEAAMPDQLNTFLLSTTSLGNATVPPDDYGLYMRKINMKFKILLAEKFINYIDLFTSGIDVNKAKDAIAAFASSSEFGELFIYMQMHYDNRNFPEFPAGDNNFIPKQNFFLMGDNRYNSLDFRYSHNIDVWPFVKIDKYDPYSVDYQSQLYLHLLNRGNILGTGKVRIWPPDRWGLL